MPNSSADSSQQRDAVNSALSLAIERKNMDMIRLAMGKGGNAATLLEAGIAQLNTDMITLALDKGADANVLLFAGIQRGRPAGERLKDFFRELDDTNAAKVQISLNWVKTALSRGADPNGTKNDEKGRSWPALHWAHDCFRPEVMDALVHAGAKVDCESPEGTPLMRAISEGSKKKVRYYLENGADPTCISNKSFPMRALEKTENFMNGTKAELLSLMMQRMPVASAAKAEPAAPPPPADPVSTSHDIEVSAPLELKVPPKFEPPTKTFSL